MIIRTMYGASVLNEITSRIIERAIEETNDWSARLLEEICVAVLIDLNSRENP